MWDVIAYPCRNFNRAFLNLNLEIEHQFPLFFPTMEPV